MYDELRKRGTSVTIRPASPGDGAAIQAYIGGLSPESRRYRFLGALSEVSPSELFRMTHPSDWHDQTLLVEAITGGVPAMIGEVRYAIAPDGSTCEFALSVAENWRRRRLGTRLLEFVACRARTLGAHTLVGEVLRSNAPMTALASKAGFATTAPIADARLIRISRYLSLPPAEAVAPAA